jgi:hypothetical protein
MAQHLRRRPALALIDGRERGNALVFPPTSASREAQMRQSTARLYSVAFLAISICVTSLPTQGFAQLENKSAQTVASDRSLADLRKELKAKRAELANLKKAAAMPPSVRGEAADTKAAAQSTATQVGAASAVASANPSVGPTIAAALAAIAAIEHAIAQQQADAKKPAETENRRLKAESKAAAVVPCGGPSNPCNAKPLPTLKDSKGLSSNGTNPSKAMGDGTTTHQMKMQQSMDRRSKAMETLSNVQKKTSETNSKIISKMK